MRKKLQKRLFEIVFESDTKAGKIFDITILCLILLSILTVLLESIPGLRNTYKEHFIKLEWIFTFLFTLEYFLRIYVSSSRRGYIFSFYGIIDFLSILPAFMGLIIVGARSLIVIRALRLLRIFRIFKINRYLNAGEVLVKALRGSREKIGVFLFTLLNIIILIGTMMYLIEGEKYGFTSIPKSIYWTIVTMTTVGYGDLTPATPLGQFLSSILMIIGYAIIAVPTGIITVELTKAHNQKVSGQVCPRCMYEGHDADATFCKNCGAQLNE